MVSPHHQIPENDPVQLSFSQKRMYLALSPDEIDAWIEEFELNEAAIINILIIKEKMDDLDDEYKELINSTDYYIDEPEFTIFKFTLPEYKKIREEMK
jgi:hypothetical protein